MTLKYSLTGTARKNFAQAVSEILSQPVVYMRTPTFAFNIGGYVVDRYGVLSCSANADASTITRLVAELKTRGYEPESSDDPSTDSNQLAIELPRAQYTDTAIENLRKIVASKAAVIRRALATDDLPIEITEDALRFPWFTLTGADGEADAYASFICAISKMARRQKRVTAKEHEATNDKFVMRLFLIRLGFVGAESKAARKILLRNLSGDPSWKNGRRSQAQITRANKP